MTFRNYDFNRSTSYIRKRRLVLRADSIVILLCFVSATLSGISEVPTVATTALVIIYCLHRLLFDRTYSPIFVLPIIYYVYASVSGIVFGGHGSIWQNGFATWAAGEGRIFLYFWPFLYYVARSTTGAQSLGPAEWSTTLKAISLIVFCSTTAEFFGIATVYSSHHIAGTVLGALLIVNYFTFLNAAKLGNLVFLMANAVLFLGSNSRTSIVAVFIAILLCHLVKGRWKSSAIYILLLITAFPLMEATFPAQFSRLSSAMDQGTGTSIIANFSEAALAETPRESSSAWEVSNFGRLEGNSNLAIRGFLWGRAVREFAGSPIIGAGFGRYNDTGRTFTNVLLGEVAAEATYNNPSVHNAHNSYFYILAETGLAGLAIVLIVFGKLLRHWMWQSGESDKYWSSIGLATVFTLLISGGTDHSLGAPAFGFTYLAVVGLCYFQTRAKGTSA